VAVKESENSEEQLKKTLAAAHKAACIIQCVKDGTWRENQGDWFAHLQALRHDLFKAPMVLAFVEERLDKAWRYDQASK